jgi:hypothetical protein
MFGSWSGNELIRVDPAVGVDGPRTSIKPAKALINELR